MSSRVIAVHVPTVGIHPIRWALPDVLVNFAHAAAVDSVHDIARQQARRVGPVAGGGEAAKGRWHALDVPVTALDVAAELDALGGGDLHARHVRLTLPRRRQARPIGSLDDKLERTRRLRRCAPA